MFLVLFVLRSSVLYSMNSAAKYFHPTLLLWLPAYLGFLTKLQRQKNYIWFKDRRNPLISNNEPCMTWNILGFWCCRHVIKKPKHKKTLICFVWFESTLVDGGWVLVFFCTILFSLGTYARCHKYHTICTIFVRNLSQGTAFHTPVFSDWYK